MRIIFENGEILDCENVARIFLEPPDEVQIISNIRPILAAERAKGFKEGYKTGVIDYKVKHSVAEDMMGGSDETMA